MPYIGNDIRANEDYKTIDDISSSFNGSTTSFALQVGGSAPVPFPKFESQCIISVGGVIQEPDTTGTTGFKFTGTNIVFSSAPAGGTFPDGTTAVPSITFSSDTDTGIFRSGNGLVSITSNGTKVATFPTGQGSANQVLATDGGGTLSFVDQSGGGAVGGGSDKLFIENGTTMTTNYTLGTEFGATCNALSAGPITINAGVTLTIPSGSVYTVV